MEVVFYTGMYPGQLMFSAEKESGPWVDRFGFTDERKDYGPYGTHRARVDAAIALATSIGERAVANGEDIGSW